MVTIRYISAWHQHKRKNSKAVPIKINSRPTKQNLKYISQLQKNSKLTYEKEIKTVVP